MVSLQSANWIISKSLFFFAFVFSITFAGSIQALIAKWMGDDSAEKLGFTEINPFIHLSFLDLVFFFIPFIELMIGNPVPINVQSINQSKKRLRVFFVFGSRCITYLIIATLSLFVRFILCAPATSGVDTFQMGNLLILRENLSSISYILCLFCTVMTIVNTFLAAFSAIREGFYGFILYRFEKDKRLIEYANIILLFGVLFLLIFLWQPIIGFFTKIVYGATATILFLIGK